MPERWVGVVLYSQWITIHGPYETPWKCAPQETRQDRRCRHCVLGGMA